MFGGGGGAAKYAAVHSDSSDGKSNSSSSSSSSPEPSDPAAVMTANPESAEPEPTAAEQQNWDTDPEADEGDDEADEDEDDAMYDENTYLSDEVVDAEVTYAPTTSIPGGEEEKTEEDVENAGVRSRDPEETGTMYRETTDGDMASSSSPKPSSSGNSAYGESPEQSLPTSTSAPKVSSKLPPLDEAVEDQFLSSNRGIATIVGLIVLVLVGVSLGVAWGATNPWISKKDDGEPGPSPTSAPSMIPTVSLSPSTPPIPLGPDDEALLALFASVVGDVVYESGTPYNEAALWILYGDPSRVTSFDDDGRLRRLQNLYSDPELEYIQRYLLAFLWYATTDNGEEEWLSCNPIHTDYTVEECTYSKPIRKLTDGTLEYTTVPWTRWLSGADECQWAGVTCTTTSSGSLQVSGIDLGGQGLDAPTTLIIELMKLPELSSLSLAYNQITGPLQTEFETLDLLDFTDNLLNGTLILLGGLSSLTLEGNYFTGTLPTELFEFTTPLRHLNLGGNELVGTIPPESSFALQMTSLYLHDNKLTGTIPPELGQLPIRALRIQGNSFSGSVPVNSINSIWLTSLEELWLFDNKLTGEIPEVLGTASRMLDLRLSQNYLQGGIPESLYGLDRLFRLELASNQLTGALSSSLTSRLTDLEVLDLSGNALTGRILLDSQLSNLESLHLEFNQFTGSVPLNLCRIASLETLLADCLPPSNAPNPCQCCTACCSRETQTCSNSNVSPIEPSPTEPPAQAPASGATTVESVQEWAKTVFGADVDLSDGSPHSLSSYWIAEADSLGISLNDSSFLQRYTLAFFYFSTRVWKSCNAATTNSCLFSQLVIGEDGSISYESVPATRWLAPTSECDWVGVSCSSSGVVTGINLMGQEISSTIPSELVVLPNLLTLQLGYNDFTGSIPSSFGISSSLQSLDLQSNLLVGSIPDTFFTESNQLTSINLGENRLSGGFPTTFGAVAAGTLQYLGLNGNSYAGSIPSSLGQLTALTGLRLGGNNFVQSIPTAILSLARLTQLGLEGNQLEGTIPTEIGQPRQLTDLNLSRNMLTGTIPIEMYTLSNLNSLALNENQLVGTISSAVARLTSLSSLQLSDNEFSGSIPSQIGSLYDMTLLWFHSNTFTGSMPIAVCSLPFLEVLEADCEEVTCVCCTACCTEEICTTV